MPEYIERAYIMGQITSSEMQAELKQMDGAGAYNRVLGIVNAAPADVAPVRHGRWMDVPYSYFGVKRYECSECYGDTFWNGRYITTKDNYCPNCGAKMDLEVSNGTE